MAPSKTSTSLSWYQKCIKEIQETFENPVFIVVTDDTPYVRDCLLESKDLIVLVLPVDLAIMSICSHGILSKFLFLVGGVLKALVYKRFELFLAPPEWSDSGSMIGINYPTLFLIDAPIPETKMSEYKYSENILFCGDWPTNTSGSIILYHFMLINTEGPIFKDNKTSLKPSRKVGPPLIIISILPFSNAYQFYPIIIYLITA